MSKLMEELEKANTFTVFAPTDAAFVKVKGTPEFPRNDADLKKLLLRHVVTGFKITYDEVTIDKKEFATLNVPDIVTIWQDFGKMIVGFKDTNAVDEDVDHDDMVLANNGVIHKISDVLMTIGELSTQGK